MQIVIKNNNLYYKNYRVYNGELSPILRIIILIIIFFNRDLIKYFSYTSIFIFIAGSIDSYFRYKKYKMIDIFVFGVLTHSMFLFPLIDFNYYFKPNIFQLFVLLFTVFVIYIMPYWPYLISKKSMLVILVVTHIILFSPFLTYLL